MATMKRIRLTRTLSGVGREGETVELSRWAADAIVNRGDAKHVSTEPAGRVTAPAPAPAPAPVAPSSRKGGSKPEDGDAKGPTKRKSKAHTPASDPAPAPAPAPAADPAPAGDAAPAPESTSSTPSEG